MKISLVTKIIIFVTLAYVILLSGCIVNNSTSDNNTNLTQNNNTNATISPINLTEKNMVTSGMVNVISTSWYTIEPDNNVINSSVHLWNVYKINNDTISTLVFNTRDGKTHFTNLTVKNYSVIILDFDCETVGNITTDNF